MREIQRTSKPQKVSNLAVQSFVRTSRSRPVLGAEFTAIGVTRMLEPLRNVDPSIRLYVMVDADLAAVGRLSAP